MTDPLPKHGPRHNWFFSSYIPLVRQGNTIRHDNLWTLLENQEADYQYKRFKHNWDKEMTKERPSISFALWKTYYPTLIYAILVQAIGACLQFGVPILTPYMIKFLNKSEGVSWYWGYVYGFIVLVVSWASSVFWYKGMWLGTCVGMKIRSACMSVIYEKIFYAETISKGKFINLFASDAATIYFYMPYVMPAAVTPVTVILTVGLLSQQVGWVCAITLVILLILLPCALYMGYRIGILRFDMQKYADQRLKITNEMVQGIRIVKYYSWENAFMENISSAREQELQKMKGITFLRTIITFIPNVTPTVCMAIMFLVYGFTNSNGLSSSVLYTSLSLMNMLRLPLAYFSSSGVLLFSISAAFDRMSNSLVIPNRIPYLEEKEDIGISISDGEFKWSSSEIPTLENINVKVEKGDHVMITGTVGSGKTSLIMSLMGEIPKSKGTVVTNGSIAYVPQQAWIYNATVRDNILFGSEFNEERYSEVTEAAGLIPDFAQFADGDNTEIGERGVNLSGGQKQRISIARALYSDRDIYILDDPFSALDAHVSVHVFNNAIKGLLMDKTVILATNQLQFTREASHVILVRKGKIHDQGPFDELAKSSKLFSKLLATAGTKKEKSAKKEEEKKELQEEQEPEVDVPEEEKNKGGLIQTSPTYIVDRHVVYRDRDQDEQC